MAKEERVIDKVAILVQHKGVPGICPIFLQATRLLLDVADPGHVPDISSHQRRVLFMSTANEMGQSCHCYDS